jgi:uncharacterized protein YhbP (UPF0306 family)
MTVIDKRIITFIKEHHILTLATAANNKPYCCSCFYVYLEQLNIFVFTSDDDTRHVKELREQSHAAGAIALETTMVGKIRGVQFTGMTGLLEGDQLKQARKAYLRKFPVARLAELHLWKLEPDFIKMTDNRLGFGKKLIWHAN